MIRRGAVLAAFFALFPCLSVRPGPAEALRQAKETECLAHVRELRLAMDLYQERFGKFPDRLEDLLICGKAGLVLKQFYCDEEWSEFEQNREEFPPEGNEKKLAAWFKAHPPGYVYVRKQLDALSPAEGIVLFERRPSRRWKRSVAFADGHVEEIADEKFLPLAKSRGLDLDKLCDTGK